MNDKSLLNMLRSELVDNLRISPTHEGFNVKLPYNDYMGEPIEMSIITTPTQIILEDLGHTSGLLFSLAQHGEEAPGHQLVRNLADAYKITMDYDRGVLSRQLSFGIENGILDFIKVLISIQTVIPELQRQRTKGRVRGRLAARLGREIKQLRLPVHVQRRVEVSGKHETWVVDYKYVRSSDKEAVDVIIVTADLGGREPRRKAEHVLTLATDVLDMANKSDLRVVYDLDGNGDRAAALRAAGLIIDYQDKVGYKAYDYSDISQKVELASRTIQELSPLAYGEHGTTGLV